MPNACTCWGFTGISSMWFGWSYSRLFTLLDGDQENTRMNTNGQETTGNVIHVPGSTGLPLEIYPYSAGVRGGLVGGAAMAMLAVLYGLIGHQSIWYPVNLLAAAGSARISAMSYDQLLGFDGTGLVLAFIIHAAGSALVGLLYGIALPMFPRRPLLLGGILAPVFWSGILYAGLGIINPALQARIDWGW